MNKSFIKELLTNKIFIGIMCFLLGGFTLGVPSKIKAAKLYESITELEENITTISNQNEELSSQMSISKNYLELTTSEKELVDLKIEEVKKSTVEEKARLKAEEEAKRLAEEQAKKEAEEAKKAEEKEKQSEMYNTGLTFEDIARNPSENKFKYCTFTGKILQVIKGADVIQYRMAIDGDYDKVVLIEIENELIKNGKILDNDIVTIQGAFMYETEYTTVLGEKKSIPYIVVHQYNIQ